MFVLITPFYTFELLSVTRTLNVFTFCNYNMKIKVSSEEIFDENCFAKYVEYVIFRRQLFGLNFALKFRVHFALLLQSLTSSAPQA